jgi:hypothetical protein
MFSNWGLPHSVNESACCVKFENTCETSLPALSGLHKNVCLSEKSISIWEYRLTVTSGHV